MEVGRGSDEQRTVLLIRWFPLHSVSSKYSCHYISVIAYYFRHHMAVPKTRYSSSSILFYKEYLLIVVVLMIHNCDSFFYLYLQRDIK